MMPAIRELSVRCLGAALALVLAASPALGQNAPDTPAPGDGWDFKLTPRSADTNPDDMEATLTSFSSRQEPDQEEEPSVEQTDITIFEGEEEPPGSPFSFDVTYYLYSDYIFRGINFSEYDREGRERLNHQMSTEIGMDVAWLFGQEQGTLGTFTFGTFFEWFAGQKSIDPLYGGQNLQEVDYVLSWAYDVDPLATTFTLGYTFYAFPNASGINTSEWWTSLEHNDAWMWKWLWPHNEDGVLNPWFFMAQDVGIANGGMWFEFGISHDFALFENFTLTPLVTVAVDHRWLDPIAGTGRNGTTRFAYSQIGLEASYDLTPVLHLPDRFGAVTLSGFLYYNDALGTAESDETIQDEFFGGMSLGWSFGG